MSESDYSSLPLNDEIEQLIKDISDLEDSIAALDTNLNTVGNGNPATMYAYKQSWYDGTIYNSTSSNWVTATTSDPIDVTDMRFLMCKFSGYHVEGGGTGGEGRCRVLLSDDTGGIYTENLTSPIFSTASNPDFPDAWEPWYCFIPVYDKTGSFTVKFQYWCSGGTVRLDECYVYEQIVNL